MAQPQASLKADRAHAMSTTSLQLTRRHLYMLPTRHGWLFVLALFAMLIAAINYNNGLAYAFTFMLAATAFMSMLHTHRNAVGLQLSSMDAAPVFCGQAAQFPVIVRNPGVERSNLWLMSNETAQRFDLPANHIQTLIVRVKTKKRGLLACPPVTLSTDFPFGLLFTWSKRFTAPSRCLVYPTRFGDQPLPVTTSHGGDGTFTKNVDGDDFAGLREFRPGDSLKHVHWKAAARDQQMYTKLFSGSESDSIWLDWNQVLAADTETKLSQLCQWVVEAHDNGVRYGLRLPTMDIPPNDSMEHRHRCLTELAHY